MKTDSSNMAETNTDKYKFLIDQIGKILSFGKIKRTNNINLILVHTNWQIGRYIVEYEQEGNIKATYGTELLNRLSKDLNLAYGKGFSRSNLFQIRQFYLKFPKIQTLSGQLSWSHYTEILKADNELEISFYTKQCEKENWSVRELKRGEIGHEDIGQMNLYLNYFRKEENTEGDNEPIGIILGAYKDQVLIEYATTNITN